MIKAISINVIVNLIQKHGHDKSKLGEELLKEMDKYGIKPIDRQKEVK